MTQIEKPVEPATNRLEALEGLRGIAAVIVVLFHALLIFYPAFFYGLDPAYTAVRHNGIEGFLYGNPLSVFLSGSFAVAIFFVLSGFVLSIGFFERGDVTIIKKLAAKRYIRLMLPALVSIVLVWLVLSLGLNANKQATAFITGSRWLGGIWNVMPNLADAIGQGVRSIFATGDVAYNPVLWTMKYEFVGSFIVFGTALFAYKLKRRWVLYAILAAGLFQTWYIAFVGGLVLADLYANKRAPFKGSNPTVVGLVLIFALILGGYPALSSAGTLYATMRIGWLTESQNQAFYQSLAAMAVLTAVIILPRLTRFFGSRFVSRLGKYTFSLYLTHMAVLFTVTVSLFLWLHGFIGYNRAALISILVSAPVLVLVTIFFERYVDQPSIRLSGVFANWLLGLPQKEGITAYSDHTRRPLRETAKSFLVKSFTRLKRLQRQNNIKIQK